MIRKLLAALLTMVLLICAIPLAASAEVEPPNTLGAPEHFGASHYYGDSVYYTFSAPEDMRAYIEKRAADDPGNKQTFSPHFQIDCKIDGGSWHHTPEWDSPKTVPGLIGTYYFTFANGKNYNNSDRWSVTDLFPEDEALKLFEETGWDYLKRHSLTFRARFAESFDYGETYVLSPWSKEFTLSANVKADYNKLINHAPTLVSAELNETGGGEPYFDVKLGRHPEEIQELNAMASGSVRTEIWMRKAGDTDFKYIHYEWTNSESLYIEASDYFSVDGTKQSYDAAGYEIKTRYSLDLSNYKQSGMDSDIYGPFSNVISHNMPAWSNVSKWATPALNKADEYGLIPDSLKGADMIKPITREEFAGLAVKLYENTTGKKAEAASPNPFTDTKNPEILKAFKLGVTAGTSATTFSPKEFTNREQVATMLSHAIRVIAPGADFSTAGAPAFSDQKDISSWALEHARFMSKLGIIKGTDGKFMPKATTTAQKAAGYAITTREQAIVMGVLAFEQMDTIKGSKPSSVDTPKVNPAPTPETPTVTSEAPASLAPVVGIWVLGNISGGKYNAASGKYEGGASDKGIGTISGYTRSATGFKGNYKISGDKLILHNQLKSQSRIATKVDENYWALIVGRDQYKDIPVEDFEYQISRTDDDKLSMSREVDQSIITTVLSRSSD